MLCCRKQSGQEVWISSVYPSPLFHRGLLLPMPVLSSSEGGRYGMLQILLKPPMSPHIVLFHVFASPLMELCWHLSYASAIHLRHIHQWVGFCAGRTDNALADVHICVSQGWDWAVKKCKLSLWLSSCSFTFIDYLQYQTDYLEQHCVFDTCRIAKLNEISQSTHLIAHFMYCILKEIYSLLWPLTECSLPPCLHLLSSSSEFLQSQFLYFVKTSKNASF